MTLIDRAIEHLNSELGLDNTRVSFEFNFEKSRKVHDSMHEFISITPLIFPESASKKDAFFHRKSAYLLYHWEIFDLAHRSFIEAHCGYYNAAFILLRSTLELIIRGAFFECLAHKEFRDKSNVMDKDKRGANLKNFLRDQIKHSPKTENDLETISACIYDEISRIILNREFDPPFAVMVRQLSMWGILDGIDKPLETVIGTYGKLSPDVHVLPDQTDVGRVLLYGNGKLFEKRKVIPKVLDDFLDISHKIIDVGIVVTLNLMKRSILQYDEVKQQLVKRIKSPEFLSLNLKYTMGRIKQLTQAREKS